MSQESLLERDRSLESLEAKFVASQVRERELQQTLTSSQDALTKTRQELSLVENELTSVKDERRAFDDVIAGLKEDMARVERSFGQIKQELALKSDEVVRLKAEKEQHNVALTQVPSLADVHGKTKQASVNEEHPETAIALRSSISTLKQENAQLLKQIKDLTSSNQDASTSLSSVGKLNELQSVTQQFKDVLDVTSNRLDIPQLQKLLAVLGDCAEVDDVVAENRQLKLVAIELVKRVEKMREDRAEEVSRSTSSIFLHVSDRYS